MQSLRTPIPARHTPPLLAANPAPRPLASCKVCVPIIMVLRDYYPKVCENSTPRTYAQGGLQGVTLCSHAVPPTPLGVPACARPLGMHRGLRYGQL